MYAELKYDVLGPMDDFDVEDLEEIMEEHKEKLQELEFEYFQQRQKVVEAKENKIGNNISYEQLVNMRVKFFMNFRNNMKLSSK